MKCVAICLQIVYIHIYGEVVMEVKYYYQTATVYHFCKISKLIYKNVVRSILYYTKKYPKHAQSLKETIDMVIQKQLILTERKIKKETFLDILNNKVNITKSAKKLNINIQAIYKLKKYGFSSKESMIILYFLADIHIKERKISIKRIQQILQELQNHNYTKDYAYLFCYYYLGYDTKINIIELASSMWRYSIYSVANYYCVKITPEDLDDIIQNINIKILGMITERKILLNDSPKIKNYIYKSGKKPIYDAIKERKIYTHQAHLEDQIGENRILMDVIPSSYDRWR